jgi:hypothetical protein
LAQVLVVLVDVDVSGGVDGVVVVLHDQSLLTSVVDTTLCDTHQKRGILCVEYTPCVSVNVEHQQYNADDNQHCQHEA